ncbi:MAG: hypothetical protein RL208_232 [Pseudomonadota bacterium]|jgi:site-specific DNA-methyltransferase (adenine-specific)
MQNTLYTCDNLFVLNGMNSETVDLIYLDPPFNSKRTYSAPIGSKAAGSSFKDMWTWEDVDEEYLFTLVEHYPTLVEFIKSIQETHSKAMMAYVAYMAQRIIEMHRVLKDTGSFYLHCDPTASHYLKILLDTVFGRDNFRNEIVWQYFMGGKSNRFFARKHDIILYYVKNAKSNYTFNSFDVKRYLDFKPSLKDDSKDALNGKDEFGYFSMVKCPDVWQIKGVFNMSNEYTGYPTQKPLALLERIIKASCPQNGVILDPFCGCATTCVAAERLGKRWIGIDIEQKAAEILMERLSDAQGKLFKNFIHLTKPPLRTDIKTETIGKDVKEKLFSQQEGCCNGCRIKIDIWHFEIDHIIPRAKGGGDYFENYQLLCGNCNKTKGDRPMEYLRMRIKQRLEMLNQRITFGE